MTLATFCKYVNVSSCHHLEEDDSTAFSPKKPVNVDCYRAEQVLNPRRVGGMCSVATVIFLLSIHARRNRYIAITPTLTLLLAHKNPLC